jgi:hypothetical protein
VLGQTGNFAGILASRPNEIVNQRSLQLGKGSFERRCLDVFGAHSPLLHSANEKSTATVATIVLPAWYPTAIRATPLATLLTLVVVLLPASTLAITCVLWLVTVLVPCPGLCRGTAVATVPSRRIAGG